jgi:hypothetical protein
MNCFLICSFLASRSFPALSSTGGSDLQRQKNRKKIKARKKRLFTGIILEVKVLIHTFIKKEKLYLKGFYD